MHVKTKIKLFIQKKKMALRFKKKKTTSNTIYARKDKDKLFIQTSTCKCLNILGTCCNTIYARKDKDKWKPACCPLSAKVMCVQRCHHASSEFKAWDVLII